MAMAWNPGLMVPSMKGSTKTARKMGMENLPSQMAAITKGHLRPTRLVDKARIFGLMESTMRETGRRIRCMETDSLTGATARSTMESS